jgi:peptide-methionine (R)-S-oxide reductase
MNRIVIALVILWCVAIAACGEAVSVQGADAPAASVATAGGATADATASSITPGEIPPVHEKLVLTDAEWRKRLTPAQYDVLRGHATEAPFCGGYAAIEKNGPGTYYCAGCGAPLFTADTMFTSGTGWPSFFKAIPDRVESTTDNSFGMERTEVHCARCGGHLGHVFDDGPEPTGKRYCINAVALRFVPAGKDTAAATSAGTKP